MIGIWRFKAIRDFNGLRDEFYEDMAQAIASGGSLDEVLRNAATRAAHSGHSGLAEIYSDWNDRLGEMSYGGSFAEVISPEVPPSDVMILKGFEIAGKLGDGLVELAKLIKGGRRMRSAILGAIAMPVFSGMVIMGVAGFFGSNILPVLSGVVPVEKWPLLGQITYFVTTTVSGYFLPIFITALVFGRWFVWSLPNWGGRIRKFLDKPAMSPYNIYKNYQAATLLVVLSALLKSGMSLDGALRLLADSSGKWMSMYLSESIDRLGDQTMSDPADAFDTGLLPDRVFWRIQDSSRRTSFPDAIKSIADNAFSKLSEDIILQAKVLNQASFLISGLILLGLVAGVLQVGMAMKDLMAT